MAKRKKQSKAPKRKAATLGKARKVAKAARGKTTKRIVAKAKPKRDPVVETVAAEVIEQSAPGVIAVTEVEETRKAS